uniref:Uncharacterized protein n=1 Tax=Ananas comosus var. bracteatus TaxID=296719 RepID=A0A6V7P514_ANACO|nr:unnamed protein product [Ananas comosus var. bracteatus]
MNWSRGFSGSNANSVMELRQPPISKAFVIMEAPPLRRCATCFIAGHKARACIDHPSMNVYRAIRARPAYLNAFIPFSEEFFAKQKRRCNAILVDVVPSANLGHFLQEIIANRLANRFGGYPTDFLVASGFGKFLRADDFTTRMADLTGYRCLIAVNHLLDIPENLEITFGDISISVLIQLKRWIRDRDVGRENPLPPHNERPDHHNPDVRSLKLIVITSQK